MTVFHDYKRTVAITHNIFGVACEFAPNAAGHVTCDIEDEAVIRRLLDIPEGFKLYGEQIEPMSLVLMPTAEEAEEAELVSLVTPKAETYMLKHGEVEFDLTPLNDHELRAFAKANGIKIARTAQGDAIRDKIVAELKAEQPEA